MSNCPKHPQKSSKGDYIVKVNQTTGQTQPLKDPVHQPLESGRGIAKSKWHDLELKEARMSGKGSLTASFL